VLETEKRFEGEFIDFARKVYFTNDERFRLKNEINKFTDSEIREIKEYVKYKIIAVYNKETYYNKKIDVFIENTQKLISEFLVNFDFLVTKAKEFNLILEDTELFSESYEKIKKDFEKPELIKTKYNLYENWRIEDHKKSLIELETNEISKRFSFLNRWVVFKKI
jgi:hypothetical protein